MKNGERKPVSKGRKRVAKKAQSLNSSKTNAKEKALAIEGLRHKYPLDILLGILKMARSIYYYHLKTKSVLNKHEVAKAQIKNIYQQHKGKYGYRRITLQMNNEGMIINHKTVFKLMGSLGMRSLIRRKKYRSYRGK